MTNVESSPRTLRVALAPWQEYLPTLKAKSVDLIVTSPPYFIGKSYDTSRSLKDFEQELKAIMPQLRRVLRPGGSICWQVGNHVQSGSLMPLDWTVHRTMERYRSLTLRNRIIWTFGHGEHCTKRFSGRHETILWYSNGENYRFDLDGVRVPQKYPGKRHYRGPKLGELSGNPEGKNPGDVWEIPNVKANHIEKTDHPCQFPVALAGRLIEGLCPPNGVVLDPYAGSGSTAVAAALGNRSFLGCDVNHAYVEIANERLDKLAAGKLRVRPDMPIYQPSANSAVARRPDHFRVPNNEENRDILEASSRMELVP